MKRSVELCVGYAIRARLTGVPIILVPLANSSGLYLSCFSCWLNLVYQHSSQCRRSLHVALITKFWVDLYYKNSFLLHSCYRFHLLTVDIIYNNSLRLVNIISLYAAYPLSILALNI